MNATKTELQKLAGKVAARFEVKKRDNGDTFYAVKRSAPSWVTDLCRQAHGDMLPDDYKYEYIMEALEGLENYDDPDDIEQDIQPDVYNHDLHKWLSSHLARAGYVDEAVENFGHSEQGIDGDLMMGQTEEKREVLGIVRSILEARIEEEAA